MRSATRLAGVLGLLLLAGCGARSDEYAWLYRLILTTPAGGTPATFPFNTTRAIQVNLVANNNTGGVSSATVQVINRTIAPPVLVYQDITGPDGTITGAFSVPTNLNFVSLEVTIGLDVYQYEANLPVLLELTRTISIPTDISKVTLVDGDGDGSPDTLDAYPADPARAALRRQPHAGKDTVAFEDSYPAPGAPGPGDPPDLGDFNDYVARARIETDLDSHGDVVALRGAYQHIARSSDRRHRLNLRVPTFGASSYALRRLASDGTLESESSGAVGDDGDIELLPDSSTTLSQSNGSASQGFVPGKSAEVEVMFASPALGVAFEQQPLDLWLDVIDTGRQVHFPRRYFNNDGTDQYMANDGFPWALFVPGEFNWPVEGAGIETAYSGFRPWFSTGGGSSPDWYQFPNAPYVFPYRETIHCQELGDACPPLPPTALAGGPYTIDEGSSALLTGFGSDPNGGALGFAWDLDGDGTFESPGETATFSAAGLDGPSMRSVGVRVCDVTDLCATATATVNIANVAPVAEAGADLTVDEGASAAFSGSFTDPGSPDTHTIAWEFGDGAIASGGLTPTHAYADDGAYAAVLTVTDDDGGAGGDTATVTVHNVAPLVTASLVSGTILEGQSISGSGSFADPGADTWTGTVDYGDGSGVQTLALAGHSFALGHAYAAAGTYALQVTVADDDGGVGNASLAVVVEAPLPTPVQAIGEVASDVADLVAAGRLSNLQGRLLTAALEAAVRAVEQGRPNVAILELRAFIFLVNGYVRNGKLTPAEGTVLTDGARAVISQIRGGQVSE